MATRGCRAVAQPRLRKVIFALATLFGSTAFALLGLEVAAHLLWTMPPSMADFRNAGLYARTPQGCGLTPGFRRMFPC